jgi:hypothetical protein
MTLSVFLPNTIAVDLTHHLKHKYFEKQGYAYGSA